MRLNAYLARAGIASRRKADDLIKAGRVRVNGETHTLDDPPKLDKQKSSTTKSIDTTVKLCQMSTKISA